MTEVKDTTKIQMQSLKNFADKLGFDLRGNHFVKGITNTRYNKVSVNTMVFLHNHPCSSFLIKLTLDGLGVDVTSSAKYREALAERLVKTVHIIYNKRKKEIQVTSHVIKIDF